jgi:hypothetical protein
MREHRTVVVAAEVRLVKRSHGQTLNDSHPAPATKTPAETRLARLKASAAENHLPTKSEDWNSGEGDRAGAI